jgi:sporulation protein YlmC with PRC-barrel domain
MDVTVAQGAVGGGPTPPMGYPGGDQITPDDMMRPDVSPGDDVLDETGQKVGEVHELSFAADTGKPTRLVVRKGFIFKDDTEVPIEWVEDITDDGIMLNVPKSKFDALAEQT